MDAALREFDEIKTAEQREMDALREELGLGEADRTHDRSEEKVLVDNAGNEIVENGRKRRAVGAGEDQPRRLGGALPAQLRQGGAVPSRGGRLVDAPARRC
ncbi:hypothetical protein GCM10009605_09110 [Nocardiopsis composta]